jgi:hypothetical protein
VSSTTEEKRVSNIKCKDGNTRRGVVKSGQIHVAMRRRHVAPGCTLVDVDVYEFDREGLLSDVLEVSVPGE